MFFNYKYNNKKDIVIVPKSNDKNSIKNINKVDIKPNSNKSYDNIRSIVESDDKKVEIEKKPKNNIKNNLKNNIV